MLGEAIASVLAQTSPSWTAVVSDNADSTQVRRLVESFADPRIRYIGQPGNLGAAGNFDFLLRHADTPYCALLHDDDVYEPVFLERTLAALTGHGAAWAIANGWVVRLDTRERYPRNRVTGEAVVRLPAGRGALLRVLAADPAVLFSGVVMSRPVYSEISFASDLRACGDLQVWLDVAAHSDGAFLREPLFSYRVSAHNDSVDMRFSGTSLSDRLVIFERAEARPELSNDRAALGRLRKRAIRTVCRGILGDPGLSEVAGRLDDLAEVLARAPGTPAALTRAILRHRTLTLVVAACAKPARSLRKVLTRRRWDGPTHA